MSYITPVTNRSAADIAARNSKAFMNVTDWNRIYGNAELANSLASIMLNQVITFNAVAAPTTSTIASVVNFNTLLANIERTRLAMIALIPTLTEIKDDWEAGISTPAPDYTHVNQWETVIDAIWDYWSGDTLPVCPTLVANLTVTTGNRAIYVDCLDCADNNVDLQGTAKLYII